MAGDTAIKAAKWIFAGYYLEHGNSIDWQDMAYCQKKYGLSSVPIQVGISATADTKRGVTRHRKEWTT